MAEVLTERRSSRPLATESVGTERNINIELPSCPVTHGLSDNDPTVSSLVYDELQGTLDIFAGNFGLKPMSLPEAVKIQADVKFQTEYRGLEKVDLSKAQHTIKPSVIKSLGSGTLAASETASLSETFQLAVRPGNASNEPTMDAACAGEIHPGTRGYQLSSSSAASAELSHLAIARAIAPVQTVWHAPWKLQRVISGHQGWVQCIAVDPSNEWFATGGNDRLIKIWDLASGTLKLSLTGHINTIKGLCVSERHPYLFSCAEDNRVKCWDLEQNKVVRDYHGHLSGVYCLALHPSLDILATGGRDAVVRVWDMRTKAAVHVLEGHKGTIQSLSSQALDPQLISGSQDKMVRLWDLAGGKCRKTLTNHKKSIRSVVIHPTEYAFASCAADNIKVWHGEEGKFERNIEGANAIINCATLKVNEDSSIFIAGSNNGQLNFWDWKSGKNFQTIQSRVQPGSMESENGIFACALDKSETRLITGECDKTIKIWKEDETAEAPENFGVGGI